MRLPYQHIEVAAASDESRPDLTHVYFDAENETLRAADGFILAVVPAENVGDGEVSGPISQNAIKYSREHFRVLFARDETVQVEDAVFERQTTDHKDLGERLNYVQGLAQEGIENRKNQTAISVALLNRLAEAICDDSRKEVILYISDNENDAIAVRSLQDNRCYGLIMPMALSETQGS